MLPTLASELALPTLTRWPVMSLPPFCLKTLTFMNPSKLVLRGCRVGLARLLGKILTYKI